MLLQLSATVPQNLESAIGLADPNTHNITSASAPAETEYNAWHKDRQKKDNHNQSKLLPVHCNG